MSDIIIPARPIPGHVQPPLRRIDKYVRIQCSCLPQRVVVTLLSSLALLIIFHAKLITDLITNPKWPETTRPNLILASFWGCLLASIPGGYLAAVLPANKVFGKAIAVSSLITLLSPLSYEFPHVLIAMKAIQGVAEGCTIPALYGILRHWAPPVERSSLVTIAFCGMYIGISLAVSFSTYLMENLDHSFVYYLHGCVGLCWYLMWKVLVTEKPSLHPSIATEELLYIENSLGVTDSSSSPKSFKMPWRALLTSMPCYSIFIANFCKSWNWPLVRLLQSFYIQASFPTNFHQNILLGPIPYILLVVGTPIGGLLADRLMKNKVMTTTGVRKVFNSIGLGMEATLTLIMVYANTASGAITVLLFKAVFSGVFISGLLANPLDVAPRYASILIGIGNCIGSIAVLISIHLVNNTLSADSGKEGLKKIFIIGAILHYVGVIFYAVFASGKLQPWANPPAEEDAQNETNSRQDQNNALLETQPTVEVNNCGESLLLPTSIELIPLQQPVETEDSDVKPSSQAPSLSEF